MDWLRRNWPDLIIGLALIAVMAGIVVTLLSGGSFWPLGSRPSAAALPPAPAATPPPTAVAPLPQDPVATMPPVGDAVIPVLPSLGAEVVPPSPGPQEAAAPPAPQPAPTPTPAATAAPTPPAAAAPPGSTASLTEASYRISVAALSNPDSANRLQAELTGQGYPSFIGRQGELYLVLVGPYRTRAEADQVAARLRAEGRETAIYFFAGGAPATASAAPTATPPAPAAVAEGELRYLQVGAYATLQGAQPQIERMQALGYTVTQRRTEGGLIRLLIGPFNPTELQAAQNRLSGLGIEHFVTR